MLKSVALIIGLSGIIFTIWSSDTVAIKCEYERKGGKIKIRLDPKTDIKNPIYKRNDSVIFIAINEMEAALNKDNFLKKDEYHFSINYEKNMFALINFEEYKDDSLAISIKSWKYSGNYEGLLKVDLNYKKVISKKTKPKSSINGKAILMIISIAASIGVWFSAQSLRNGH